MKIQQVSIHITYTESLAVYTLSHWKHRQLGSSFALSLFMPHLVTTIWPRESPHSNPYSPIQSSYTYVPDFSRQKIARPLMKECEEQRTLKKQKYYPGCLWSKPVWECVWHWGTLINTQSHSGRLPVWTTTNTTSTLWLANVCVHSM